MQSNTNVKTVHWSHLYAHVQFHFSSLSNLTFHSFSFARTFLLDYSMSAFSLICTFFGILYFFSFDQQRGSARSVCTCKWEIPSYTAPIYTDFHKHHIIIITHIHNARLDITCICQVYIGSGSWCAHFHSFAVFFYMWMGFIQMYLCRCICV